MIFRILLLFVIITISNGFRCNMTLNVTHHHEATILTGKYNLCDLQLDGSQWGYYFIEDNNTQDGDAANYTYYFNIANNVRSDVPDPECYNTTLREQNGLPAGFCVEKQIKGNYSVGYHCGDDLVPIEGNVGAFQMYKGNKRVNKPCWRLHNGITEPVWSFYDENDPAFGIVLEYTSGDWCPVGGINRKFRMEFICNHDIRNVPDKEEVIVEPNVCEYQFTMKTNKGCPTECKIIEDLLCNAKGICDYDFTTHSPRCFCYQGYYGEGCELTTDPDNEVVYQDPDNSYVGALVVVILLLMVILFILGYLFLRYSRLGKGVGIIDNYQNLKKRAGKSSKTDEYADD